MYFVICVKFHSKTALHVDQLAPAGRYCNYTIIVLAFNDITIAKNVFLEKAVTKT